MDSLWGDANLENVDGSVYYNRANIVNIDSTASEICIQSPTSESGIRRGRSDTSCSTRDRVADVAKFPVRTLDSNICNDVCNMYFSSEMVGESDMSRNRNNRSIFTCLSIISFFGRHSSRISDWSSKYIGGNAFFQDK